LITSDSGFSVEVLGRTGLRYTEGDRVMLIDSEVLAGPHGLALYLSSLRRRDPPNDSLPIDEEAKTESSRTFERHSGSREMGSWSSNAIGPGNPRRGQTGRAQVGTMLRTYRVEALDVPRIRPTPGEKNVIRNRLLEMNVRGALVGGLDLAIHTTVTKNIPANLHRVWSGRVKHEGVEGSGWCCLEYHQGGEGAPFSPRIPTAESVFATENWEEAPPSGSRTVST
jgi:hypothetical protein